jgi:hypothetical protein
VPGVRVRPSPPTSPAVTFAEADEVWDLARWVRILDRIEHRQPGVGLRFWGPPLWLEVTMTGLDSDRWAEPAGQDGAHQSWDWQSSEPCTAAMTLAAAGGDDDSLLAIAARYTIDNLVLNATHEIGEWLRFDGRRIYAAHGERVPGSGPDRDGRQGNGQVCVHLSEPTGGETVPAADGGAALAAARAQMSERAARDAGADRHSAAPGTVIAFDTSGPVVTVDGVAYRSPWSLGSLRDGPADPDRFAAAVHREVHGALVSADTARICEAFRVDGRQVWSLSGAADGTTRLAVTVDYDPVAPGRHLHAVPPLTPKEAPGR